ncbi:MAG TPA: HAMP domain-containing sensor histidine kinase [Telluria sp.]|nr:HAMP domain-containing sensor histidine kinase [Telluria sp.]
MALSTDQKLDSGDLSPTSRRLLALRDEVLAEWTAQVRRTVKGADRMPQPILINTLPAFHDNIAESLTPGYPRSNATSNTTIASDHGSERARMTGYGSEEVIYEYQLFRAALALVAERNGLALNPAEWQVINASIDAAVRMSVKKFIAMHDEFRSRIAASLSHDMRTPLTVILGSAQLLALTPDAQTAARIIPRIIRNAQRLEHMIQDQLDALRFHRGPHLPLLLSHFDMALLAAEVRDQVNEAHPERCQLIGAPVHGHWCRDSMRRALENLVVNAIKYGDSQPIRIKLDESNERMILSVHNSGKPIPPECSSAIFDYLQREDESEEEGWGIGLPFVRNVAESHGGSVTLDSSAAAGTTFIIDVPVDCRPFVDAPIAAGEPTPGS